LEKPTSSERGGEVCKAPILAATEVPELESARLRLRPWREADIEALAAIVRDPEVMRYLGTGLRYRVKRAATWLVARVSDVEARTAVRDFDRHWQRWGFGEWAAEEKASGELVGRIGLVYHPDWPLGEAKVEIGWTLARRAWGRGLATEGARVALDHAFDQLELDRVISATSIDNVRSQRVMQKLGMRRQGEARWHRCDMVWYAIDRDA
jgi:RimJ/RimL family protein N-acetyltransferase